MAKIVSIGAASKDKYRKHKVEIEVEFDEPVTVAEAQTRVLDAISKILFNLDQNKQ